MYEAWVRGRLVETLRKHLLHTDEHPTYSRMFTFSGNLSKLRKAVCARRCLLTLSAWLPR